MANPGCGCKSCSQDPAVFWPAGIGEDVPTTSNGFYWSFEWHCARSDGWGEWFFYGDEMI